VKLDRLAFQEALDEIGAKRDRNKLFIAGMCLKRRERGVELLADNLFAPAFPETLSRRCSNETQNFLSKPWPASWQSPVYLSQRAFLQAIYPEKEFQLLRQATPNGRVA